MPSPCKALRVVSTLTSVLTATSAGVGFFIDIATCTVRPMLIVA
jgi:hypothetical protein